MLNFLCEAKGICVKIEIMQGILTLSVLEFLVVRYVIFCGGKGGKRSYSSNLL